MSGTRSTKMSIPANWRTLISGIGSGVFAVLSMLAVAPQELGEVANIIPYQYKAKFFFACTFAAFILRCWNSYAQKDKQVTGGSVQQTIGGAKADAGTQTLVDATVAATKESGEPLPDEFTSKPLSGFITKAPLIALLFLPLVAFAGDPAPAPTPVVINSNVLTDFAQNASKAGNFSLAVSPGYLAKVNNGAWGLAVEAGYQINQWTGAFIRADLMDGSTYVASGSLALQYPITFGKITFRPFIEAGVGSALGGAGDKNKNVFAIAGGGAAVDVWQSKDKTGKADGKYNLSAFVAVETWEPVYHGISIYRGGIVATAHF
jgi:hypothetical protein